jgi:hypothetical protein
MSLHWLAAPSDTSSIQRVHPSKKLTANKEMAVESDLDVSGATRAERRNGTTGSEDNTKVPTANDENVPPGGCTPIGLTAQGQLVFPMQCQALLERHRGPMASQDPVPTNSIQSTPALKGHQAVEPARPLDDESTDRSRAESHGNAANAKAEEFSPSGEAKPGSENSEPEVSKETENGRRNMRSSHSRDKEQWFNPLTFR